MRQGNKVITPYCWLYVLQRDDDKPSRAACVVGKKVHQLAVKRHHYQRWLRQISSTYINHLPVSYDMVWVAQPKITEVKEILKLQNSLQGQLDELIGRLKNTPTSQSASAGDSSQ
jgi:ribonuclease P protein component